MIDELHRTQSENFCRYLGTVAGETNHLLFTEEEVPDPIRLQDRLFSRRLEKIFVLTIGGEIRGFISIKRGAFARNCGVGVVSMAVSKLSQRRGHGTALLQHAIAWATKNGFFRLQLQVSTSNGPAIRLYEKQGFVSEGIARDAARVDGRLIDKLVMSFRMDALSMNNN